MGHFISRVIWEGFQREAGAKLNPRAVRPASASSGTAFSEQPVTQEYFKDFWHCLGDTEMGDGREAE